MEPRDLLNFGTNSFVGQARMNQSSYQNSSCSYYGTNTRNSNVGGSYNDFEGVQDLSYSAQCLQAENDPHEDQDVSCMDLSLLLTSKVCDRQQIEDELPLNLTGKAREEEINRRLRQRQQSNYSYSYSDPPRNVFLAPDFLGFHELQDLRTHIYIDDTTSLNLSYCPQTLDLSAQSLDLSLTQDERLDAFSRQDLSYNDSTVDLSASHSLNLENYTDCDVLNLTCHNGGGESGNADVLDFGLQDLQQSLPPASSLPLPLSITQTLTSTLCNSSQQYTALDLQKNTSGPTPEVEEKKYTCAQCGADFSTTQDLHTHRESHSLSKPFPCDQCPMRFTKMGTLNRHQKNSHANVRPFQCDICHKHFGQRHDLQRHKHTHRKD